MENNKSWDLTRWFYRIVYPLSIVGATATAMSEGTKSTAKFVYFVGIVLFVICEMQMHKTGNHAETLLQKTMFVLGIILSALFLIGFCIGFVGAL